MLNRDETCNGPNLWTYTEVDQSARRWAQTSALDAARGCKAGTGVAC